MRLTGALYAKITLCPPKPGEYVKKYYDRINDGAIGPYRPDAMRTKISRIYPTATFDEFTTGWVINIDDNPISVPRRSYSSYAKEKNIAKKGFLYFLKIVQNNIPTPGQSACSYFGDRTWVEHIDELRIELKQIHNCKIIQNEKFNKHHIMPIDSEEIIMTGDNTCKISVFMEIIEKNPPEIGTPAKNYFGFKKWSKHRVILMLELEKRYGMTIVKQGKLFYITSIDQVTKSQCSTIGQIYDLLTSDN